MDTPDLDPKFSWTIHTHIERHYYVDVLGGKPHRVNGLSCSCGPKITEPTPKDKAWRVVHKSFDGLESNA